jgi:epoxyqueuosine reductase
MKRDIPCDIIIIGYCNNHILKKKNDIKSTIIIAIAHLKFKPEMDWWFGSINPPGNQMLIEVNKKLKQWLNVNYPDIKVYPLPYHVENGGIYLKDAAVRAGLGCIGKNNLLITPQYGPQVRLRAMLISKELVSTGPNSYDPCTDCAVYCRNACPVRAFNETIWTKEAVKVDTLPARDGTYNRRQCNITMDANTADAREETVVLPESLFEKNIGSENDTPGKQTVKVIRYCRNCELACPVGQNNVL